MIIGFIGTGNMGGAILRGYIRATSERENKVLIHNRSSERNEAMAQSIGHIGGKVDIKVCNDNIELAEQAEIIVIGVEPDGVSGVLKEISAKLDKAGKNHIPENKIIVSMAAGVSISKMEEILNEAIPGCGDMAKIIRVMPNTPAQVGEAMTSMSRNKNVAEGDFLKVKEIFDSIGLAEEVEEEMIDCVIGVSGSSPAYTYMYIEALMEVAVMNGMDEKQAKVFVAKAVKGAAEMVLKSGGSPEQLRRNVCSPNGATFAAVNTLMDNGFMAKVKEGAQAAIDRSKEMTAER